MSGLEKMRDRLADKEMLAEVAKDAWDQIYDGPDSSYDACWDHVAQAIYMYVNYGTIRWDLAK